MATSNDANGNGNHHKRAKSSVLKSIIGNRQHKRNPSAVDALSSGIYDENRDPRPHVNPSRMMLSLPNDHPHASQLPLGELVHNQLADPFPKPNVRTPGRDRTNPMEAAANYKAIPDAERPPVSSPYQREKLSKAKNGHQDAMKSPKPKKSKSQTSLAALLSRPKSSKGRDEASRGEESVDLRSQPQSAGSTAPPPIYAQFASRPFQPRSETSSVPLNDARVREEISRYTPVDYSPSKQRNFDVYELPTLGRPNAAPKSRPKSEYLTSSTTGTVVKDALQAIRRSSNDSTRPPSANRGSSEQKRRPNSFWGIRDGNHPEKMNRTSSDEPVKSVSTDPPERMTLAKRGSRVMAAVAAFNMKAKEAEKPKDKDKSVAPQDIESAFEALLDSRNVPQNMRQKLRSLDARIKADFIKQDKAESQGLSGMLSPMTPSATIPSNVQAPNGQPSAANGSTNIAVPGTPKTATDENDSTSPRKRSRPRSKTFTLNRSDKDGSPLKKQKSIEGNNQNQNNNASPRNKSSEYRPSSSSKSLTSAGASDAMMLGFGSRPKPPVPQDFVGYLRDVRDPRVVEVGRLHKLRLVLRNERVAWVEEFLGIGGMMEVVGLLQRIMGIEWREEHEDALLHEVLLCLKALCTTKRALRELDGIQTTLFPQLVRMIFDEEHKGPSEFNTRGIVFSLLLTYLADASKDELATRATAILSYLRDPGPPEGSQPLGFIQSMHQSRPYRVWGKEVVSVTKEVFWIFLHQTNVIPVIDPTQPSSYPLSPPASSPESPTCADPAPSSPTPSSSSYADLHFPKERPPVPAAPYVGGVEWDATNYISAHLDLMNGLLASFETAAQRNALRHELRVSGFEKTMGASLRTCKEKFYGAVHDGLKTWVAASLADGWDVEFVRRGQVAFSAAIASGHYGAGGAGGGVVGGFVKTPKSSPQKKKNNNSPNKVDKNGKMLQEQGPLKVEVPVSKLDWELGDDLISSGGAFGVGVGAGAGAGGSRSGNAHGAALPLWD